MTADGAGVLHWPLLALVCLGIAVLTLLVAGWRLSRLSRRTAELARAAERIGLGDLDTPVPQGSGAADRMADALEVMRRRLNALARDLRRRENEAEAIVAGVAEGVFAVDRERRVRYLNAQFAAQLGIAPEDALGHFCGDVLRPIGPGGGRPCEEHCPIVHARFRGGARATEHVTTASGEARPVVITSSPLAGDRQVQVARDETEIEATRRMRDAVLANISHEFRTPLSAQLASIELLLDRLPDLPQDEVRQLVEALQRGTLRLTQLIDNLLESVRIESGEIGIRRRALAIDEVVEESLEMTRPLLDQRSQEVAVELPYPLPAVEGDPQRLVQVFVNLLANASKYAPEGSLVTIGGERRGATLAVWVADRGPGLPAGGENAPFTRFWRSGGEEPEQGGAGLGLFIVKSIVERHGGRVHAASSEAGTRVDVVLPVAES